MTDQITFYIAFLFGALSFASPCVLPLIPAYLSYLAGDQARGLSGNASGTSIALGAAGRESNSPQHTKLRAHGRSRIMINAAAFVAGFSCVFVALGASATLLAQLLLQHLTLFSQIAGGAISLAGLHLIGIVRLSWLTRSFGYFGPKNTSGIAGAFGLGLAFGFAWTPCIGPVLAAVLALAARTETAAEGIWLLVMYSAGLGVPFLLSALMMERFLLTIRKFNRHLRTVEIFTGVMLLATGVLMIFGEFATIGFWLLDLFPALQYLG